MNIESIKVLFEEMRKSGVQFFEHTDVNGETHKIIMNGAEITNATGVVVEDDDDDPTMGFDAKRVDNSLYENSTLKLKDFN